MKLELKTRIYYTGDMANLDGFGIVCAIRPANKFGPESYDIQMEDGRQWRGISGVSFDPSPGRRFITAEEYKAGRKAALAVMKESMITQRTEYTDATYKVIPADQSHDKGSK